MNGMNLVDIRTSEENDSIKNEIKSAKYLTGTEHLFRWWIGATNMDSTIFYWINNGDYLSFNDFHSSQPDHASKTENCVELWHINNHQWNDMDCYTRNYFICKKSSDCMISPAYHI